MVYGRDLSKNMEYVRWENFNNLVEKAVQLINSGTEKGTITRITKLVSTGKNAKRNITDYEIDMDAVNLLERLSSYKLNKSIRLRNETVILTMVKKYCTLKKIPFVFQFRINEFRYDCCVNNNTLIEFDEQQHHHSKQIAIDERKNIAAQLNGFKLIRFNISHDIIDIIIELDRCRSISYCI